MSWMVPIWRHPKTKESYSTLMSSYQDETMQKMPIFESPRQLGWPTFCHIDKFLRLSADFWIETIQNSMQMFLCSPRDTLYISLYSLSWLLLVSSWLFPPPTVSPTHFHRASCLIRSFCAAFTFMSPSYGKFIPFFFFSILWPYYSGGFCFPPNIFKLGFVIIVYVCWTEELLFLPTLSIQRGGHCLIFSPQILTIKKVKNELNNSMNLNWKCLESCLELLFCSTQCTRHSHNQAA